MADYIDQQIKVPEHLTRLSRLMDSSIRLPGGYRIGCDGIIGLIPGIGDIAGLCVSAYIIVGAARAKASMATLLRMVLNVVIEAVVGLIPVLGDIFDMTFKANQRNMRLLEQQLRDSRSTSRVSVLTLSALGMALLLVSGIIIWAAVGLVANLISLVF